MHSAHNYDSARSKHMFRARLAHFSTMIEETQPEQLTGEQWSKLIGELTASLYYDLHPQSAAEVSQIQYASPASEQSQISRVSR